MSTDAVIHNRAARRAGRPAGTSLAQLMGAAVHQGLDSFTIAEVAQRAGVAESTVYGYVATRAELFTHAAGSVFEGLDTDYEAQSWVDYVDEMAQRIISLAVVHPGLEGYVLFGPYTPSTVLAFDAMIGEVQRWLPQIDDNVAWVLASRPVVASLTHLGDPVLQPMSAWLRRAMLEGFDKLLAEGNFPDTSPVSWRDRLENGL